LLLAALFLLVVAWIGVAHWRALEAECRAELIGVEAE
jgi:hypothetical protein